MTNTTPRGPVTPRAHTLRSSRAKAGISSRFGWRRGLITCALFCTAACRDSSALPTSGPTHFVLVAAGALVQSSGGTGATCLLTLFSGTAHCWGFNYYGTYGNGSTESSNVPVPAGGGLSFAALGEGEFTACGIERASHSLYCWGYYGNDLAADPLPLHLTPVLFDAEHKFNALSEGSASGCALTSEGDAYCWGEGMDGELGNGSRTPSSTPVAVVGGHIFRSIGVGVGFACGLTTQGDAYCWGDNESGTLGNGSTDERNSDTPELVTGQHHFTSLSVGEFHVCALTQAGQGFCWGHNGFNELGIGSRDDDWHPVPEQVTGNITFSVLNAGGGSSCGITRQGVAYCWGSNVFGALGNGTTDDTSTPVAVSGGLTFVSIQAGGGSACGITSNADVYCWGDNSQGNLGDGTTTSSLVPVKTLFSPTQ
jgi:hypothetical protein